MSKNENKSVIECCSETNLHHAHNLFHKYASLINSTFASRIPTQSRRVSLSFSQSSLLCYLSSQRRPKGRFGRIAHFAGYFRRFVSNNEYTKLTFRCICLINPKQHVVCFRIFKNLNLPKLL